jgi:hypothetical protein
VHVEMHHTHSSTLVLKILVSVVRFRPGPPRISLTKRRFSRIGVFVWGLAVLVSGLFPVRPRVTPRCTYQPNCPIVQVVLRAPLIFTVSEYLLTSGLSCGLLQSGRVLPLGWFSKYVVSFSNAKVAKRPWILGLPTSRSRLNVSQRALCPAR